MAEGLHIGVAPTRRHLDLAVGRYREIADLVAAHKVPGLVALDGAELWFVPLTALSEERLGDFGVGPEATDAVMDHLSALSLTQEAAVIVVDRAGDGTLVAGLVNLILRENA